VAALTDAVETNRGLVFDEWLSLTNGVLGTGNSMLILAPSTVALPRHFFRLWPKP
jgi:hypothetical protein